MNHRTQNIHINVIAVLIAGLMFVWPIMHTIGLRYSLAGLLFIATALWFQSNKPLLTQALKSRSIVLTTGALVVLTIWFAFQGFWFSTEAGWIWKEFRSQWVKDILFWLLGLILGAGVIVRDEKTNRYWLMAMILGLAGLVVLSAMLVTWVWATTGAIPKMYDGLTGSRTMTSFVTNMLLAFLVGDFLARARGVTFLPWRVGITIALIVLCLFNTLLSGTRHGWVGVIMLSVSGVMIHYINGWRHLTKKAVLFLPGLLAVLMLGGWFSWKVDPRWGTLKETLPIAWDIDSNKAWINSDLYPLPKLSTGESVNDSNYQRPAWIHAGVRMVLENPLGVGYGRHAFGHELVRRYPESNPPAGLHAHSGMIDLAVGGGLPAVMIWTLFVLMLVWLGGSAYFKNGSGAGLVLLFLTTGFFGRSLIDSNMRDHSFEQFMFIAGFLLANTNFSKNISYATEKNGV